VSPQPIAIDCQFQDWRTVSPEFRDTVGDPVHRNHAGWGDAGPYVNQTGRNDIVVTKVSYDSQYVYFYVRTRDPLSPRTDPNWMLLFIDTDSRQSTGWLGYDVLVNATNDSETTTTLQQNVGAGYEWHQPLVVERRMSGSELELAIPRSAVGPWKQSPRCDFKWADNIRGTGEAADLTLHGDVAPNDRYSFRVCPAD
jgi:hypothetical protein